MKRCLTIMLFLSILLLPGLLWAADPIIGTWKLNVSKSKYPPGENPPKEQSETYREKEGGRIELIWEAVQADGTKELFKATWPAEGGAVSISEGQANPGRSYVETLLKPGEWYVTVLQDGKQIAFMHKVISKNGKAMTQKETFIGEDGIRKEIVRMHEKQ